MGYLAVSIGDTNSVAVHRRDTTVDPTVFETTTELSFAEDGTVSLGTDTQHESEGSAPTVAASISRVGRPPAEDDVYLAEDLVAHAVNCLVAMTRSRHGGVTPSVAVVHPDSWGTREIDLLLGALDHTGLRGVHLVPQTAARSAFAALDSGAGLPDDVALAIGALAVLEGGRSVDAADTDALPVIASPQALAFSEAIPVAVAEPSPSDPESERRKRKPLLIVTGLAAAVILASIGIAAALGTFSDGPEVTPPPITDAQSPSTTSVAPPTSPQAVAVPFPTTEPAPPTTEAPPALPPQEAVETVPPQPAPPAAPPPAVEPPPVAEPPPATTTRSLPPRMEIPRLTLRELPPALGIPGAN